MKKFINKVIMPIVVLFCILISCLTGERILKTFMSFRQYEDVSQDKLNNSFLSVKLKSIDKIATNNSDKDYYIGELSDGKLVVLIKDGLSEEVLEENFNIKGIFLESPSGVNDIKNNMIDENEKNKYADNLSNYIIVISKNPYNLSVSTYVQCCLGILIIIGIFIIKIRKKF